MRQCPPGVAADFAYMSSGVRASHNHFKALPEEIRKPTRVSINYMSALKLYVYANKFYLSGEIFAVRVFKDLIVCVLSKSTLIFAAM